MYLELQGKELKLDIETNISCIENLGNKSPEVLHNCLTIINLGHFMEDFNT